MLLFLILSSAFLCGGTDAAMDFYLEDAEVVDISEEYFDTSTTTINTEDIDDKGTLSTVMDLMKDMPEDALVAFNFLERCFDHNRDIGLELNGTLCQMIEMNDFVLGPALASMNMTKCPVEKGHYEISNFLPDDDNLPDNFPMGYYLADIRLIVNNEVILGVKIFVQIY